MKKPKAEETTDTDRLAKIRERAKLAARREVSVSTAKDGGSEDRFYDPDDYGSSASSELADADVGWLPIDGRPR